MAISPNTHIVYQKNVRMEAKGKGMMPNILSSKFDLFFSFFKPACEEAISLKLGIQLGLKAPPIPLQHHNLKSSVRPVLLRPLYAQPADPLALSSESN